VPSTDSAAGISTQDSRTQDPGPSRPSAHSDFDKILGDLSRPSTSIVFGEKGSGKTAIRLQIADRVARHNAWSTYRARASAWRSWGLGTSGLTIRSTCRRWSCSRAMRPSEGDAKANGSQRLRFMARAMSRNGPSLRSPEPTVVTGARDSALPPAIVKDLRLGVGLTSARVRCGRRRRTPRAGKAAGGRGRMATSPRRTPSHARARLARAPPGSLARRGQ
jgi:hypothetical protein